MNPKEKKIREVYGDKYELLFPDSNGWTEVEEGVAKYEFLDKNIEYFDFESSLKWRPLSLNGIEHNNYWCRTDEDFPDKNGIYVFITKNNIQHEVRLQFPLSKEEENHFKNDFTHFRIQRPHPLPIY
jgi:hypothetical protein